MAAIEAAIKNAPDYTEAIQAIKEAIAALPNYTEQLGAIITAIEALPDYSKQLEAIAAAVEAIPDYSDKLDAIQTALAAIADNIKAQEGQYADELAALKASIDAIKSEVAAGNKSQEDALAEIIALLESGAIAGGGSGSGSGGEGSGDEPIGPYILLTTEKPVGSTIEFACYDSELTNISGVDNLKETGYWVGDYGKVPLYQGILTSQEVKLYGTFTEFQCSGGGLTEIDTQTQGALVYLMLYDNPDLKTFNFKFNESLKKLDFRGNSFSASELSDLVKQLSPTSGGQLKIDFDGTDDDFVVLRDAAEDKGWTIYR